MTACFGRMTDEENFFMTNGRMLLEESITLFDGKIYPMRRFSAIEIISATENFNEKHVILHDGFCKLYMGFFQGRAVIVKKHTREKDEGSIARDIVIASRMTVHKNVLKLIGCCLETKFPILVFESIDCDGTLHDRFHHGNGDELQSLPWKDRLKIAVDLSNLVVYFHTAFPRPLIYRDLKPLHMLLEKDGGIVKLFDFSLCVSLPEGESYMEVDRVIGTYGYISPEYLREGKFNEKSDVYSFGATLLVLLSGKKLSVNWNLVPDARKCVENDELFDKILDPKLSEEPWPGKNMQFKTFLTVAVQCIRERADDRPDITDVARQLREMYRGLVSGF